MLRACNKAVGLNAVGCNITKGLKHEIVGHGLLRWPELS
jgi:hypothetical protein